ncbi:hypothetical protein CEXT_755221 [Caerostris extrusa]|uniref:Uncharacterized protein n=1 Tax=Caerostris extrusa TaxID=172846 RepID=A0AAV4Y8S7_CAEEX|nr:hypothetical protein CEXT_755221 [Caerostris extrusa]
MKPTSTTSLDRSHSTSISNIQNEKKKESWQKESVSLRHKSMSPRRKMSNSKSLRRPSLLMLCKRRNRSNVSFARHHRLDVRKWKEIQFRRIAIRGLEFPPGK